MTQTKFLHFDAFLMLASFPFIQVRLDIVTLSQTFLRMAFDQIQTLAVFYAGTVMTVLPIQFCCHLVIVDVGNLSGPLQLTPLHVYSQALQCISLPTFLSNPSQVGIVRQSSYNSLLCTLYSITMQSGGVKRLSLYVPSLDHYR